MVSCGAGKVNKILYIKMSFNQPQRPWWDQSHTIHQPININANMPIYGQQNMQPITRLPLPVTRPPINKGCGCGK